MAKRKRITPRDRRSAGSSKAMAISAKVRRLATTAGKYTRKFAFEACVRIPNGVSACGTGRNPRKALASAMTEAAKYLRKRSGAFAGLK